MQAAALNVKINAVGMKDHALAEEMREQVMILENEAREIAATAKATAAERGGF